MVPISDPFYFQSYYPNKIQICIKEKSSFDIQVRVLEVNPTSLSNPSSPKRLIIKRWVQLHLIIEHSNVFLFQLKSVRVFFFFLIFFNFYLTVPFQFLKVQYFFLGKAREVHVRRLMFVSSFHIMYICLDEIKYIRIHGPPTKDTRQRYIRDISCHWK